MCAMLQKDDNNRNSFDIYVSRAQNDADQKLSLFFARFFFFFAFSIYAMIYDFRWHCMLKYDLYQMKNHL